MLSPISAYKRNTAFKNQPEENINDVGLLISIYIKKIKTHLTSLQRTLKMFFHKSKESLIWSYLLGGKKNPKQKQKK